MILVGIVVGAFGKFGRHGVEIPMHLLYMGEYFAGLFNQGRRICEHHLLGQIADSDTLWHGNGTLGGFLKAGYDFQHGTLAGTVFADKSYFVIRIDYVVYVVEEFLRAELY